MSVVLYNLIHNNAEKTFQGDLENVKDNYDVWIKHWFDSAETLAIAFEKEGLTARNIRIWSDHQLVETRYAKHRLPVNS